MLLSFQLQLVAKPPPFQHFRDFQNIKGRNLSYATGAVLRHVHPRQNKQILRMDCKNNFNGHPEKHCQGPTHTP